MKFIILVAVILSADCGAVQVKTNAKKEAQNPPLMVRAETQATPPQDVTKKTPKKKKMEKEVLAKKIEAKDAPTAEIVRDAQSEIEQMPASFLRNGAIYRVEKFAPTRPILIYIGCSDEKDFCAALNADEKAFYELASRAGLLIEKREPRISYAEAFLKIVYSPVERLQILHSVNDLKERPNMPDEEKKRFQEILKRFEKTVVAPDATDAMPSVCTFFAVKDQDLARLELIVTPDGKIEIKEIILEKNLPIPYAL